MQTGIMLAFYVPLDVAEQLYALAEAAGITPVDPAEMHLTLVFMGDTSFYDDGERQDIEESVERFVAGQNVSISGIISGVGRFNTTEGSDTNALYASFDSPDLPRFRQALYDSISWNLAVKPQHGFTPHITLAYIPADAPTPELQLPALEMTFDRVVLAWGDDHLEYGIQEAGKTMPEQKAGATPTGVGTKEEVNSKVYRPFSQKETAYVTLHTNPAQACANCRFFKAHSWEYDGSSCHIVENWPDDILATGWCNEWRAVEVNPVNIDPLPVVIVDEVEEKMTNGNGLSIGALTHIERKALGDWMGKIQRLLRPDNDANYVGFKISNDGQRWEALYTNNWRDDDRELFPEAAIDRFIEGVKTGRYPWPELQYAHLSGLAHGKADNLIRIGHHVLATGTFDDTDLAAKLRDHGRKCIQDGRKLALSHRFWFDPAKKTTTGEYIDFETFEITWFEQLPGVTPSNPFTIMEFKTMSDQVPPALRQNLESILGKQRADELINLSMQLDEQALAQRRDSKTLTQSPAPAQSPAQVAPPTQQAHQPVPTNVGTPATPAAPPSEWEAKFTAQGAQIERAVTALETATKTLTETNTATSTRLNALEQAFAGLKSQILGQQELAPPSRNSNNRLPEDDVIAKWLTDQEAKTAQENNPSLIEYALGMKAGDAQTQVIPGGAQS